MTFGDLFAGGAAVVVTLAILFVLILVHELGHFIVALIAAALELFAPQEGAAPGLDELVALDTEVQEWATAVPAGSVA